MAAPRVFAAQIAPMVIAGCINTGLFPSVVIAQAIQESGSGTSQAAVKYNNLFGHAANPASTEKKAQLVKGGHWWKVYDSIAEAIQSHIAILKRPLYRLAGVIAATTPYEQALALQHAGYDTGADRQQYAAKLAHIIKVEGLATYDQQLFAIERNRNKNHLAFHEQGGLTKILHTITG